jgi:pimeloyl-ACP methyl ester carboxylesterase
MGEENLHEFGAMEAGPGELRAFLEAARPAVIGITGDEIAASLGDLIADADRAVLTGDFADWLATGFRTALAAGVVGWLDDDMAFMRSWGFDLGTIDVPVTIWHGDADRMVPFAHGRWLAEHVRGARAELCPGDGHLSITVARHGEILDALLAG